MEQEGMLVKKVKCNFRTMGKKFGKLMKGIAAQTAALSQEQIAQFEKDGSLPLTVEGQAVEVSLADVEIISEDIPGWLVTNEGNLTVALEVELTEELRREGMARELVNRIQNLRKVTGLEITDRIRVTVQPNENSDAAIGAFGDYIKSQVLADDIVIADNDGQPAEFDGFTLNIKVERK
jgi:isoleucyl-tRNA synthetase